MVRLGYSRRMSDSRRWAVLQVLLSGLAFGTLGVFGKLAFAAGLQPGQFLAFRFSIAALVLGAYVLAFRRRELSKLDARSIGASLLLGLLGYAVFSSCYFMALQRISASLTVLLLYTYPVLVALGAALFFKERLSRSTWIALPLASLGLALLVWGDLAVHDVTGLLFGIGSAVFYTAYILLSAHWLKGKPALPCVALIQASAGLALSLAHLPRGEIAPLFLAGWLPIIGAALLASVIAMTLFVIGLQKLPSSQVSILSTAEPISAVFLAGFFLHERLSLPQLLGGALVLAALVLSGREDATQ
jgi:drug/metabolite transporter (DMT)-like permease